MSDVFRDNLRGATTMGSLAAEEDRARQARLERKLTTQAALAGPAGRAFLTSRLQHETQAATWQPGDTLESVAHRAGRVQLLRDLLAELDFTPTTPGA